MFEEEKIMKLKQGKSGGGEKFETYKLFCRICFRE
jgi:hypothetical protein